MIAELNKEQTQVLMAKLKKSVANFTPINVMDIPNDITVNITFFGCLNEFRKQALSLRKPWNALVKTSVVEMRVRISVVWGTLRPLSLQIVLSPGI